MTRELKIRVILRYVENTHNEQDKSDLLTFSDEEIDEIFNDVCEDFSSLQTDFINWIEDGNVVLIDESYATQDAQYRNRITSVPRLYKYFIKEFNNN